MGEGALTVFNKELDRMGPQFARVLPAHLPKERLLRTILNAVSVNKKLLECDRGSLWQAAMTAAVLGIEPDGVTGQGYMVPYKSKVQFIPGYKGLVSLAFNSGYIVEGHTVRQKDAFDFQYGLSPKLHHKPVIGGGRGQENPIIGAYATARAAGHPDVFEFMEIEDIVKIRDDSKSYQAAKRYGRQSTWDVHFEAMVRKTPIRILCQHLPLTVQKAVAVETTFEREGRIVNATKPEDGSDIIDIVASEVVEDDPKERAENAMTDEEYQKAGRPGGWSFDTTSQKWLKDVAP